MEEIWKDVKGYEGYYQVSNLGRVKGLLTTARISASPASGGARGNALSPTTAGAR